MPFVTPLLAGGQHDELGAQHAIALAYSGVCSHGRHAFRVAELARLRVCGLGRSLAPPLASPPPDRLRSGPEWQVWQDTRPAAAGSRGGRSALSSASARGWLFCLVRAAGRRRRCLLLLLRCRDRAELPVVDATVRHHRGISRSVVLMARLAPPPSSFILLHRCTVPPPLRGPFPPRLTQ